MTSLAILIAISGSIQSAAVPKPLAFLVGSWRSEEVSIRGKEEVPFICLSEIKPALRGLYVQMDERFELDSQRYENHIMLTAQQEDVSGWWYSSASFKPLEFHGKVDGKKITITCQQPPYRITFDPQTEDHFKVRLEVKMAEEWKVVTRADYRRAK